MRGPADRLRPRSRGARASRGFTLLEVMIAMTLLLVGGLSVLAVFSVAVTHQVEREVERGLDAVRPEARSLAQAAVDSAEPGKPPIPVKDAPTAQPGFTTSVSFVRSPNEDPAWVASIEISYLGKPLRNGRLPPLWLYRSTLDRR